MNNGLKVLIVILVLVIVVASTYVFYGNYAITSYEIFEIDGECEQVTAECSCIGKLTVMESYPPQYKCEGYSSCSNVLVRRC